MNEFKMWLQLNKDYQNALHASIKIDNIMTSLASHLPKIYLSAICAYLGKEKEVFTDVAPVKINVNHVKDIVYDIGSHHIKDYTIFYFWGEDSDIVISLIKEYFLYIEESIDDTHIFWLKLSCINHIFLDELSHLNIQGFYVNDQRMAVLNHKVFKINFRKNGIFLIARSIQRNPNITIEELGLGLYVRRFNKKIQDTILNNIDKKFVLSLADTRAHILSQSAYYEWHFEREYDIYNLIKNHDFEQFKDLSLKSAYYILMEGKNDIK